MLLVLSGFRIKEQWINWTRLFYPLFKHSPEPLLPPHTLFGTPREEEVKYLSWWGVSGYVEEDGKQWGRGSGGFKVHNSILFPFSEFNLFTRTASAPSSRLNVRRICVHKFLSSSEIYRLFVYAISINHVLLPKVNRGSIVNEYLLFPLVNLTMSECLHGNVDWPG